MLEKLEHIKRGLASMKSELSMLEFKSQKIEELIDELISNAVEQADAPVNQARELLRKVLELYPDLEHDEPDFFQEITAVLATA